MKMEVWKRRNISSLRISEIHFPAVDLNLTGRKRGGNKMLDSWQIGGVQDSEVTADRLRDWEEKVAQNVKHADGYRSGANTSP